MKNVVDWHFSTRTALFHEGIKTFTDTSQISSASDVINADTNDVNNFGGVTLSTRGSPSSDRTIQCVSEEA
jgi:hypothetical protein